TPQWTHAEPAAVDAFETAASKVQRAGAKVTAVELPSHFADLTEVHRRMMAFESARAYATEYAASRSKLSPQLIELIEMGLAQPVSAYLEDRRAQENAKRELTALMAEYDALLVPAAPGEAPEGLGATGNPVFSRMWTLLQGPNIALPVQRGPRGLPTGVQLIGAYGSDPALLATARWVEERLR
ncbi:MAG TPA: amidase family protein, partial [Alphaproteobacteria bacterium]|nr:amidase family protein [Alphaproteobacteria bacterium]